MVLAAVGQLCSKALPSANLALCRSVIRRASAAGAAIIYLPEASDFIADAASVPKLSRPLNDSPFVEGIKAAAVLGQCWVGGEIVQAYRKVHLFDVVSGGTTILESNTTVPGDAFLDPVQTPIGKVGLLTCYDLRFPEANLVLRKRGAEIISYPSAFLPRTGSAHWNVLLRARAIESQVYILAPAQVGWHSSTRQSWGNALIVDPWGTVIAQATDRLPSGDSEDAGTFVLGDIDLEWLYNVRAGMPLWEQRRTDVYPPLA